MDTALENGDFKLNSKGYPVMIDSYEEILQRIIIRLICKKGSYVYNRDLGSEFYKIKMGNISRNNIEKQAIDYAKKALKDMKNVNVVSVKAESCKMGEQLRLSFKISVDEQIEDIDISV